MNYGDSRNGIPKCGILIGLDIFSCYFTRAFSRNLRWLSMPVISLYYRQIRKQSQSTDGPIVAKVYNLGNSLNQALPTRWKKAIESVYGSVNVDFVSSLCFLHLPGVMTRSSTWQKGITPISILQSLSTLDLMNMKLLHGLSESKWCMGASFQWPLILFFVCYLFQWHTVCIPSVTYPGTLLNANILPQKQPSLWGGGFYFVFA